jgi:transcriptional regulator with XRE-family HTH domain
MLLGYPHLRNRRYPRAVTTATAVPFGQILRMIRAALDLSQRDLAQRAGIPEDRYWRIERGYIRPRRDELERIAAAWGVPLDEREAAER